MTTRTKTGAEHLASLRDGREVYLNGKRVDDVTTHPAFRNACKSAADLYDFQARPENVEMMTFLPEGGTRRVNRAWSLPRNLDEMVRRRKALQAWAGCSYGFLGRSPDHLASALIGQRVEKDELLANLKPIVPTADRSSYESTIGEINTRMALAEQKLARCKKSLAKKPGERLLVPPGTPHAFSSAGGAIFEEVSTRSIRGDSYYLDESIRRLDPMERKTILEEW